MRIQNYCIYGLLIAICIILFFSHEWKNILGFLKPIEGSLQNDKHLGIDKNTELHRSGRIKQGGDRPLDRRLKNLYNQDAYSLALNKFDNYLYKNNRSPSSLAAVYALTEHLGIFNELKTHADSPDAMLCVALGSDSPSERALYAKKFIELRPSDMTGYLIASANQKLIGVSPDVISKLIRIGFSSEVFTGGLETRSQDLREALASTGMEATASEIYLSTRRSPDQQIVGESVRILKEASTWEVGNAGTVEEKAGIVEDYLQAASCIKEISPFVRGKGELGYYDLAISLASQLPDEGQFTGEKLTKSALLAKFFSEKQELLNLHDNSYKLLLRSTPSVVDRYFGIKAQDGAVAAEKWLVGQ